MGLPAPALIHLKPFLSPGVTQVHPSLKTPVHRLRRRNSDSVDRAPGALGAQGRRFGSEDFLEAVVVQLGLVGERGREAHKRVSGAAGTVGDGASPQRTARPAERGPLSPPRCSAGPRAGVGRPAGASRGSDRGGVEWWTLQARGAQFYWNQKKQDAYRRKIF